MKMLNGFIKRKKHEIPEIKENSSVHEEQVKEEDPVVVFEFKVKLDLEPKNNFFFLQLAITLLILPWFVNKTSRLGRTR